MITIYKLNLQFGDQTVFEDVSLTCSSYDRIGLVGRNGSGKSTLLKAIAGIQHLDGGTISTAKGARVCYLPQDVVLQSDKSILKETCTVFAGVALLQERQALLEQRLHAGEHDAQLLEDYAQVCSDINMHNPDALEAEAKKVLLGLGFGLERLDDPVATLSGGWKMRVVLAKLLLQKADFYLFDEPTNHLDIVAQEWFLHFLKQATFGFMLVCHDRYFLNQLCTTILELEYGVATEYTGNFSSYEQQKEHNMALLESAYKSQQKELKQRMETIERFRAKASKAKMAQSMLKQVEKIERIEMPPKPADITFVFPPVAQAGRIVLDIANLSYAFQAKQVFKRVTFEVERGKKIAIIAPNGVGKTTLFKVIAGRLPIQSGTVQLGHNVVPVVFDQDQTASLMLNRSVIDNLRAAGPNLSEQRIRSFAGSFLFDKEALEKKVSVLSGGEKNRVGMIKVLLQNGNLLLLDEPTNHLDIQSKDILLRALQSYQGTMLFVSHDHDFVNNLATDILELSADGIGFYPGTYDLYLYRKKAEKEQLAKTEKDDKSKKTSAQSVDKKKDTAHQAASELAVLERSIEKLEKEIAKIEQSFAALEYGTSAFQEAERTLKKLKERHAQTLAQWQDLAEQVAR